MSLDRELLAVGFHKGEADFRLSALIGELSGEEMDDFRAMLVVAVGVAESTWRASRPQPQSAACPPTTKEPTEPAGPPPQESTE